MDSAGGRGPGYRYFGAAKQLPGVRELFEKEAPRQVGGAGGGAGGGGASWASRLPCWLQAGLRWAALPGLHSWVQGKGQLGWLRPKGAALPAAKHVLGPAHAH